MVNRHLNIVSSSRLVRIPVNYIVYIEADGNYCDIYLHGNIIINVTLQLGQVITQIQEQLPDFKHLFARVGKSMVVNSNYIVDIDLIEKNILLVDSKYHQYSKKASRDALKEVKEQLEQRVQQIQREQQKSL